jgi:hypothetical protein
MEAYQNLSKRMDRNVELVDPWNKKFFAEAFSHCRWKITLENFLRTIHVSDYSDKTFEQIFTEISTLARKEKGIGPLTVYDITAAICRHYQVRIDKVYLIGKGPIRTVRLLKMKTNKHPSLRLKYVEIKDVVHAFDVNRYHLDDVIRTTEDGDQVETYLCVWQSKLNTQLAIDNLIT